MKKPAPAIRELARQVVARESVPDGVPEDPGPAAPRVFERLRLHLATFVGTVGYRVILSRALTQAMVEDPRLCEITLNVDGTIDFGENGEARQTTTGIIVLLSQILVLVDILVGEALMLRLVQDVWPGVTMDPSLSVHNTNTEVIP